MRYPGIIWCRGFWKSNRKYEPILPGQCIKDIVPFLPIMKTLYLLIQKVTLSSAEAEVAFGLLWYTCNPDTWEYNSKWSFFLIRCHFEFIFEILVLVESLLHHQDVYHSWEEKQVTVTPTRVLLLVWRRTTLNSFIGGRPLSITTGYIIICIKNPEYKQ